MTPPKVRARKRAVLEMCHEWQTARVVAVKLAMTKKDASKMLVGMQRKEYLERDEDDTGIRLKYRTTDKGREWLETDIGVPKAKPDFSPLMSVMPFRVPMLCVVGLRTHLLKDDEKQ